MTERRETIEAWTLAAIGLVKGLGAVMLYEIKDRVLQAPPASITIPEEGKHDT